MSGKLRQVVRSLDEYIEAFRLMVEASWKHVSFSDPYPDHEYEGLSAALGDWLQIQWELLVEGPMRITAQLHGHLVWYAEGIDETMSMRFSEPEAAMTHEVCFVPREGTTVRERIQEGEVSFPERGLPFGEFVSRSDHPWYERRPPLDFVLARDLPEDLDTGLSLIFDRRKIRFVLREVEA